MLLIITNTNDPTVDFVEEKLRERKADYFRLNTDVVLSQTTHVFKISNTSLDKDNCRIRMGDIEVKIQDISSVWYRRPVDPIPSSKLQTEISKKFAQDETSYYLRCLWKQLENCRWVNHPKATTWANTKLHQLTLARELGFTIPKSLATNDPVEAKKFFTECNGQMVVKPFKVNALQYSDNPEEVVGILTNKITETDLDSIDTVQYSITFLQEEIVKQDEIRVTVFGDDVFSASISSQLDPNLVTDWRRTTPNPKVWKRFDLPSDIKEQCKQLVKRLDLRFGAIDLARVSNDKFVFFEINPNGQWAWLEIETGMPMSDSLLNILLP